MSSQSEAPVASLPHRTDEQKSADEPAVSARPVRSRGWKYRLRVVSREPTTALGVLLLLLFGWLIAAPVLNLLNDAIRVQYADQARTGQAFGELTTYYFERVFLSPASHKLFWAPLANTLSIALGAMAIAVVVGATMAWLLTRTDMWGGRWLSIALIVPYMLPSWTLALAWRSIFKNRTAGGSPGWLESFGLQPPDWLAYGRLPATLILGLHFAPFVILLFGNALKRFDSQLEDSARMLGAGSFTVTRRIVVPLLRPSLLSAATLIFAKCLDDFGVVYLVGLPVNFDVLATSLFRSTTSRQPGVSAVLAGAIILIGVVSLIVDARLVREARRFVTVGGKGLNVRRATLGRWRPGATALAILVFGVSAAIPLTALLLTTLMRTPGVFTARNFTFDYWLGTGLETTALRQGILRTPDFWAAVWNTVYIVGIAAVGAGVLGLLVGYVVMRVEAPGIAPALRFITFMPYLVPGIAFAVAYLSIFAVPRGPIPALYGTGILLILALLADQMPFASRAGIASMSQLGREPEEAAQIAGAGWWRRLSSIVIPIQRGALTSGVLLPFISGVKGLSLVIVLAVPGTDLLTTYAVRLIDFGYEQAANAVVLMICAVAFFGTLLIQRLGKSNLAEGMGN